jgi:hypothetical protein
MLKCCCALVILLAAVSAQPQASPYGDEQPALLKRRDAMMVPLDNCLRGAIRFDLDQGERDRETIIAQTRRQCAFLVMLYDKRYRPRRLFNTDHDAMAFFESEAGLVVDDILAGAPNPAVVTRTQRC